MPTGRFAVGDPLPCPAGWSSGRSQCSKRWGTSHFPPELAAWLDSVVRVVGDDWVQFEGCPPSMDTHRALPVRMKDEGGASGERLLESAPSLRPSWSYLGSILEPPGRLLGPSWRRSIKKEGSFNLPCPSEPRGPPKSPSLLMLPCSLLLLRPCHAMPCAWPVGEAQCSEGRSPRHHHHHQH